jgi:hypothetical protein
MWWVIVLAVATHSAYARLTKTFEVTRASWASSHIVVVETTPIDGAFEVVESWKGDLAVGSRVVIPELVPPANAIPISAYPKWSPDDPSGVLEQIPKQPVGSQLVLFLKRKEVPAAKGETRNPDWSGWSGSDGPDSMKIAAVWINGDRTYSFQQQAFISSPLVLSVGGKFKLSKEDQRFVAESEEDLKRGVAEVLQVQKDEEAAITVTNGRERALRLKPYANSKMIPARLLAIEELGKAGPAAVSTIGEMLDDPAYSEQASELVNAMVKAGGKAVGAELNRRLEQDLAFWSSTGPSLSQNWWNQDPTPSSPLRNRYGQTYSLVYGLTQVGYPGALNTAIRLRDLWRALPQFASIGDNQMAEECDKLIAELQTN